MQLNTNDYKPNEILKFIREYANLTQKEFAKNINKSEAWQQSNELGRANYYFKDLIEIAKKYDIEIILKSKKDN